MERSKLVLLVAAAVIFFSGCSGIRINDDLAHLVNDSTKYDVGISCEINEINVQEEKKLEPEEMEEAMGYFETHLRSNEDFAGSKIIRIDHSDIALVRKLFQDLGGEELENVKISRSLMKKFAKTRRSRLLVICQYDGFHRTMGGLLFGAFKKAVIRSVSVNIGGGLTLSGNYSQKNNMAAMGFAVIDKKSGRVVAYNVFDGEIDPRKEYPVKKYVYKMVKDLGTVKKKNAKK